MYVGAFFQSKSLSVDVNAAVKEKSIEVEIKMIVDAQIISGYDKWHGLTIMVFLYFNVLKM